MADYASDQQTVAGRTAPGARLAASEPSVRAQGRLAVILGAASALLLSGYAAFAFVIPLTPVRLERRSAALIDEFGLWSFLEGVGLPIPNTGWPLAFTVLGTSSALFGAYAVALYAVWARPAPRRVLAGAFAVAVLFLGVVVFALPNINTDIYNYIVTGRVAAVHDANPYVVPPDAFPEDPILRYAGRQYTTHPDIKLPAWMVMSVPLARVAGDDPVTNLLAYRALFFAFGIGSLLLVAAILRKTNPRYLLTGVIAWGWNPIVVLFAGSKVDTVMVFFLLLGTLLLASLRGRAAWVALTLSTLVKLITLPLLAALCVREVGARRWRELAIGASVIAATVGLLYAPFGLDLILDHAGLVERRTSDQPGGTSTGPARVLLVGAFALMIVWVGLVARDALQRLVVGWAILTLYFSLFLAPLSLSWYLLALIALVSIAADWRLILVATWLSVASFISNAWESASTRAHPLPELFPGPRLILALVLVAGAGAVIAVLTRGFRGGRRLLAAGGPTR